ncbi:rab11 family-interacting protein 4A-like [Danio aesculapii]|uniref:rab11 family-interacting protein 4A-like n=1 Tax=Danio aesculapii TaxID=1142201 RepID=UPI0024BFC8CC|nr:rab11 family-interacting protein 4A-like [Danio aesculapii]
MDGNVFPDQEQLLVFLKKLKEVFDVCDEDADGYIRVEHFVDLGLQFGQGDEVKKFAKYLDPNAHGRINFKDFCHGVFAIKGCEEILKRHLGPPPLQHSRTRQTMATTISICLLTNSTLPSNIANSS